MEQNFFLDKIAPWLLGLLSTLLGFIIKLIADYYYLKSPRLEAYGIISSGGISLWKDNKWHYRYTAKIAVQNHSKNEAYGFEFVSLEANEKFMVIDSDVSDNYISDTKAVTVELDMVLLGEVDDPDKAGGSDAKFNTINKGFKIVVEYKNQLGKKYRKKLPGEFKRDNYVFHVV